MNPLEDELISPYVRRRRLGAEIVALRESASCSSDQLAQAIGVKRQTISRLENARARPDQSDIIRILDHFGVTGERRAAIMTIAREAQENGWWERHDDEMGPRQALYANLEAGASYIAEYQVLLPGLLQIPAFTEARAIADRAAYPARFSIEHAVRARSLRQGVLNRPIPPTYEVIIDEVAVRRPAAAPEIVRAQLDYLISVGHERPTITIRVLPVAAKIAGYAIPRSAFFTYRYPDPGDPVVVAVDTITTDEILIGSPGVDPYIDLYARLRDTALSPSDTLDFLATVAEELPDYCRS